MGKLHELLAVEPDLRGAGEKIIKETINTFTKKEHHFTGRIKSYQPKDEEGDKLPQEKQEMVTTVAKKLEHTQEVVAKYLDAIAQKELTNTAATAILEIDGKPLFEKPLPATLLLAIEGRLKQLREVYSAMPTLDPSEVWHWEGASRTYKAEPKQTFKMKKVYKNHVKAEATDKHPAQVEVYTEDVSIGIWTENKWSGMITPAEKADVLARVDKLTQAVKQARQRANDVTVMSIAVGDILFNYIHEGLRK